MSTDDRIESPGKAATTNSSCFMGTPATSCSHNASRSPWSPNLPTTNYGSQQQVVNTAHSGWNDGWNSHVTTGTGQRFIPGFSPVEYPPMHPNTIANGQPDPILQPPGLVVYDGTVQLPDFGGYDPTLSLPGLGVHGPTPQIGVYGPLPGFGEYGPTLPLPSLGVYGPAPQLLDLGVYDGMGAAADCFANFNPFTQRGDLTAIDPQATMTSFNQLSLPTTASMLAAPALAPVLPVHTSNMFTAPVVPPQITRSSNVNINARTCNFPKCGKVLTRKSGLRRHQKSHFPPEFHCLVHGCKYRDEKGFTRADKLRDHQRRGHRMAI